MFEQLKGKRLLYLGGIKRAAYVVMRARELGIYVIVADYNEDSPAKVVADEGVLVDAMDVEALVSLCIQKSIDGILTGYADILMPVCKKVAEKLGLYCYYTETLLSASTNKEDFKELCRQYQVPVPKTFNVNKENFKDKAYELTYPVFVKPIDASGSRGANACKTPKEFIDNYEYALSFSKKQLVTVEEFLHGTEFILDYLVLNGMPYLLSFADRYTSDKSRAAINSPNLMVMPSRYFEKYKADVDENVCNMLKACGLENGLVFLQGYANDENITFYEMGCRLGGTWPYIDEYFTSINPLDLLFNYSITGEMLSPKLEKLIDADFDGYGGIIYFLANKPEGYIYKVRGLDKLEKIPGVVNIMIFSDQGENFDSNRQTDIRLLSVHIVGDSLEELMQRINIVYENVDYLDENGRSLLQPVIKTTEIENYYSR